jgi:hypothetical protein
MASNDDEPMDMDMDVDPVDGGPLPTTTGAVPDPMAPEPPQPLTVVSTATTAAASQSQSSGQSSSATATSSQEEQARQAIDMLHGDDVGNRVAAAHRLEAVAAALGPERTREVCNVVSNKNTVLQLCYAIIELAS